MRIVILELSDEMDQYYEDIKQFLDLMVHKLHKNVHKGRWEGMDARKAFRLLLDETDELNESLREGDLENIYLECADVANFAMIIASIVRVRKNE